MTAWRERAVRRDGRVYVAKKKPRAEVFGDPCEYGTQYGVVVLRTHDPDVAVALAQSWWSYEMDDEPMPSPSLEWWSLKPWGSGAYDRTWEYDAERGMPVAVFQGSNP